MIRFAFSRVLDVVYAAIDRTSGTLFYPWLVDVVSLVPESWTDHAD